MNAPFWLENPKILFNKKYILEIWPFNNDNNTIENRINSFTRTILFLGIGFYLYNKKLIVLITTFLTIILLVIIYYLKKNKNENFNNQNLEIDNLIKCVKKKNKYNMPTRINPLGNTLLTDIKYKPEELILNKRKKSVPAFNNDIKKKINNKSKNLKLKHKIYKNLGNELFDDKTNFDISMRQFYTVANNEIPSNQKKFAEFCYGNMKSSKIIKDPQND